MDTDEHTLGIGEVGERRRQRRDVKVQGANKELRIANCDIRWLPIRIL